MHALASSKAKCDEENLVNRLRQTAVRAAKEAGALLNKRLGDVGNIDYKGAFNIVTDVDRASERCIVEILRCEYPAWGVLAEEGGQAGPRSTCRWLIDPIDGTTNYAHAYPFFSISIAAEDNGKVVLGVVYNPVSQELFWAEPGQGAWLGETRIAVSRAGALKESLLATGFPPGARSTPSNNLAEFAYLTQRCHGVRRDGSAALDLCFIACGRLDGFWEQSLAPWDLAAGTLVVSEAGGRISNLNGGQFDIDSGDVLATNGIIHQETLEMLGKAREGIER